MTYAELVKQSKAKKVVGSKLPIDESEEPTASAEQKAEKPGLNMREKIEKRMNRLPRGIKADEVMEELYLPDKQERESIKAKAVKSVRALVDVIDNFNRIGYGVRAGAMEIAKPGETTAGKVAGEIYKGLKREIKPGIEDVMKAADPKSVKAFEDALRVKVFGKEFNTSQAAYFAGDILSDPLTYVPFGWITKGASKIIGTGAKGAERAGRLALGDKIVDGLSKAATDTWYKKVAPMVNIQSIFKRKYAGPNGEFSLDDAFKGYLEAAEAAPSLRSKQIREIAKTGERNVLLTKALKIADEKQTKQIFDSLHNAADESVDAIAGIKAKDLGMNVDDFLKLNQVDRILGDLTEGGIKGIPADTLKNVDNLITSMTDEGAKAVSQRLLEGRGIKRTVSKITKAEAKASAMLAKERFKFADSIYKEAVSSRRAELSAIQKDLKAGVLSAGKIVEASHNEAAKAVKSLSDDFSSFIQKGAVAEQASGVKARLDILKQQLQNITKGGIESTGRIQGSMPIKSKVDSLVRQLEADVGRAQVGSVVDASKDILASMNATTKEIGSLLGSLKNEQLAALRASKTTAKGANKINQMLLNQYQERSSVLMKEISGLQKLKGQEYATYKTALTKIPQVASEQASKYEKGLNALATGWRSQKVMREIQASNAAILEKHIASLPVELQGPTRKLNQFFQEQRLAMSKSGLSSGVEGIYAPRSLSQKFVDEFNAAVPSRTGFLKHRKFEKSKEFFDWLHQNGGKPNEDIFHLALDHAINTDMAIARKNLKETIINKFGSDRAVPKEIKKSLEYMFGGGLIQSKNPAVRMVMQTYGKALNTVKFMLTAINPAFHGRNVLGFPFLAATTAGAKAGFNPLNYTDALAIKLGKEGKIGEYGYNAIREAAEKSGYFGASLTRGNIETSAKHVLNRYSWKDPRRWMGEMFKLSAHSEDVGRYGALVANLRSGKKMDEAINAAQKAMFDYNLINSPVDKALDGMLGFYVWTRRNLPRQLLTTINDPKQYAILSRALTRISNREKVSQEEIDLMNQYDKETLTLFGDMINGVREFTSLGFFPVEEAYRTVNALTSGDVKGLIGGRVTPLLGSFMDWYYGKDSFANSDFGTNLPAKYTAVIPKGLQKALKLTVRERPKYRAGEKVGTEKVLYGDPDTIFMIRRLPLGSRIINDLATLVDSVQQGKPAKGAMKYFLGVRSGEMDLEKMRRSQQFKIDKAKTKAMKARGAKTFERPYVPKEQKESPEYKQAIERLQQAR